MGIYSSNIVTEASELFTVNESQYIASRPGLKTITESKKIQIQLIYLSLRTENII